MAKGFAKFFILAGFMLAAAAQERPRQAEPVKPGTAVELPSSDAPGLPVDPKAYKLGPEDVIAIRVWRDNELTGQYVVRPDGKITLPLAGEVAVQDKTLVEVQNQVIELYSKFINRPEISVSLTRVGSKKYYLVGKLLRTGVFPLVVPTTVLEAINGSGGFQEFANQKKVTILRGNKRIYFNYNDVIRGKNTEQNIMVENGDHIVVR
jgi:polysaccharide export outer membrane protein